MCLSGCKEKKDTSSTLNILLAWTGEFSNERFTEAIEEYQDNYEPIVIDRENKITEVSFETDFETAGCSVTRLSQADNWNINKELTKYIDLAIDARCDNNKVIIPIDWWYADTDSWVNDHTIWSYLIRVVDVEGEEHYFYFRTDYSSLSK